MPGKIGNTNALKHGFYSRRDTIREAEHVEKFAEDLTREIEVLHLFFDRIVSQLEQKETYAGRDLALLHLAKDIASTIGALTTRRTKLTRQTGEADEAIEQAVLLHSPEWDKA